MWLYLCLLTLILWGLWGFLAKVASHHISPQAVYLWGSAGALFVTVLSLIMGFRFEYHAPGIFYSVLAGLAGGGGVILFYYAIKEGKVSLVVTITALYPVVTILLSYLILKEEITLRQAIGMLFALIAMVLMAG